MEANESRWQRMRKPGIALIAVGVFFLVSRALREQLGFEFDAESIQGSVGQLGFWAPVGFITLVMFRQVFVLPSMLLMTTAGLLFGAPMGTLYGGIGITLNAFTLFGSARLLGRDWVRPRLHERFPDFEQHASTAGPWVIALMTGHPMGVLTPFHLAGGITGISVWVFFIAVAPAAILRAGCYSFLGANILEPGSSGLWIATGVLLLVAALPLAHPGLRARLLSSAKTPKDDVVLDQSTPSTVRSNDAPEETSASN